MPDGLQTLERAVAESTEANREAARLNREAATAIKETARLNKEAAEQRASQPPTVNNNYHQQNQRHIHGARARPVNGENDRDRRETG